MSDQSHNKNSLPETVLKRTGSERLSTILWILLPPLLTFALVAVVWEWAVHIFETPAYILPAPSRIWDSLLKDQGSILGHSGITLFEAVSGFIIGSILGALLGIFFAYSRLFAQSLLPYVIAANTIPVVAIAPIIIIWFGHGIPSKIAVTAFLSFFPLALNMMKGLRSYDHTIMDVFHVAAASKWQRFVKMRLPASLPYVFVGLKLNVTFAVIGAIIAEFVQADRGLGFVIMTAYRTLNMPRLWSAMLVSAATGILFFALVALAERWIIPWHSSMRKEE